MHFYSRKLIKQEVGISLCLNKGEAKNMSKPFYVKI